jgi:hypothetical protein
MQKTLSKWLIAAFLVTLTGCELQAVPKREGRIGQLTDKDQTTLTTINDNMNDLIAAREYAGFGFINVPLSEKASKISSVLRARCTNAGSIPEVDTIGSISTQTINGVDCPLYWYRARGITVSGNSKVLRIMDNFEVLDNESARLIKFRDTAGLVNRRADGVIEARNNGTSVRTTGRINFNGYTLNDLGAIDVEIATDQTRNGDTGNGYISITITTAKGKHIGWINWKIARNVMQTPVYSIDNAQIEHKDFERLFSSFELGKIMDSSERMK